MSKKRIWVISLILLFFTGFVLLYTFQYYHADSSVIKSLKSDGQVLVTQTDYGWFFDGPSEEYALIFYPGAKVEETAYAPLLHRLAQGGLDVCLVQMPLHFALLGEHKADEVIEAYDYSHWYIGGHSLGGAVAAIYASENSDQLDGVILCAAYASHDLDEKLNTVLIYGSEDGVLKNDRYRDNLEHVPANAVEHVISGGNHAQFGFYGPQKGDKEALISTSQQVEETAAVILEAIAPCRG